MMLSGDIIEGAWHILLRSLPPQPFGRTRIIGTLAMPRSLLLLVITAWAVLCGAAVPARAADRSANLPGHEPFLLSQPDLSSPRATLHALLSNAEFARRDFEALGPTWKPRPALQRMMATIDTEGVGSAHRVLAVALAATRLAAVLVHGAEDRIDDAPDAAAVKAQGLESWRVPGTPIVIARVRSGTHAGQFLFTPETMAVSDALYMAARTVPGSKSDLFRTIDEWSYAPGPLVPRWVIAALPEPLRAPVAGQAVWQWIGLILLLTLATWLYLRILRWGLRHDQRETRPLRRYGHPVAALSLMVLNVGTLALAFFALKVWGDVMMTLILFLRLAVYIGIAWLMVAVIQRGAAAIVILRGSSGSSLDGQLIRVVSTLLSIAVLLAAVFFIADLVGIPVGPLLAGLGIGGFAIALAVRSTLENVIGGLTLFADRPARVGEFCRVGSESGTVEEIGLRTTKLRRLDDTLVTIPNAEMAQVRIENITRRRKSLFNPRLGLRYETTGAQIKEIQERILALLADHPKVVSEGARVRFTSFGDYTLNLDVFAYVDESRLPDFVRVQEELNLRVMEIVQAAGAAFAFPSQTNYLARDSLPAATPAPAGPREDVR